ncbi:outer membrane protein assembly factor BamB family protein [Catellatospora coxensis]|uniref:outer membrane protein assembly factor BamB family protein n=1 Tax=Catellatospora coxensis TaxID=310354 RepID=UPI001944FD87|nr:PQQ-binding-like beta-propeller repeat protein [Catellatospora coxensis]
MYQQPASSTTAVIDLGAGWRQQPSERDHPGARTLLRPVAAAVAAALVFALGGAVPARRLQEVATVALTAQGDFQVLEDLLLVRGGDRLAGYNLTDGSQRWDLPLPGTAGGPIMPVEAAPGMILTAMEDAATGRRTTYAVDVAAGVVRWQDELPMMALGDVAIAVWSPGEDRTDTRITVRDVRTGQQRWTVRGVLPALDYPAVIRGRDTMPIWTLQTGGELTERDLRDGRVLRRLRLDLGAAVPVNLSISGDELIVETVLAGVKTTARFATADLSPVALTAPYVFRTDCGAHWCTTSRPAAGGPVDETGAIVDKETGEVRGRFAMGSIIVPTPLGLLVAGPEPRGDGLPVTALLDPATARPLADLTGWDLYSGSTVGVTVLLRGRTHRQVAWLTPGGLELTQLPVPPARCAFAPRAIACPAAANSVTVWRVTG